MSRPSFCATALAGSVVVAVDQLVVLINGPAGIGKSSVAPRVAARAANGACIAGDALRRFIVNRAAPVAVDLGLAYIGAAALTDVFLDAGYELVVVDFVFEHPRHISRYTEALSSRVPVLAVTLWAPLDVVQRRHAQRRRDAQRSGSAESSWHAIAPHLDDLGTVIDATGTVEQTLAAIDDMIDRRRLGP